MCSIEYLRATFARSPPPSFLFLAPHTPALSLSRWKHLVTLAAETFDLLDVSASGVVVLGGEHPAWTSYDYQWLLSVCSGGNSTITRKQWLHYVYNLVKAGETSGGALEASSDIVDHLDTLVTHIRSSGPEKLIAADRTASILSVQAEKIPGVAASDHTQLNAVRRVSLAHTLPRARTHTCRLTRPRSSSLTSVLLCMHATRHPRPPRTPPTREPTLSASHSFSFFPTRHSQLFATLDADGDGRVDLAEFLAALKANPALYTVLVQPFAETRGRRRKVGVRDQVRVIEASRAVGGRYATTVSESDAGAGEVAADAVVDAASAVSGISNMHAIELVFKHAAAAGGAATGDGKIGPLEFFAFFGGDGAAIARVDAACESLHAKDLALIAESSLHADLLSIFKKIDADGNKLIQLSELAQVMGLEESAEFLAHADQDLGEDADDLDDEYIPAQARMLAMNFICFEEFADAVHAAIAKVQGDHAKAEVVRTWERRVGIIH